MEIVFVEIRSEISAGTRGASLGPDAMYVAALNQGSDLFDRYDYIELPDANEALGKPVKHQWAKRISVAYLKRFLFSSILTVQRCSRALGGKMDY